MVIQLIRVAFYRAVYISMRQNATQAIKTKKVTTRKRRSKTTYSEKARVSKLRRSNKDRIPSIPTIIAGRIGSGPGVYTTASKVHFA